MSVEEASTLAGYTTSSMTNEERVLDTLRYRMSLIATSLRDLRQDLSNPTTLLPPWDRILLPCHDLGRAMSDLQALLHNRRAFGRDHTDRETGLTTRIEGFDLPNFINSAHVHPTTDFPREQENALGMLITKKRAPMSDTWLDEALKAAKAKEEDEEGGTKDVLSAQQLQDLWNWAPIEGNSIARQILYDEGESPGEREEEDEDEDEEMEDVDGGAPQGKGKERAPETEPEPTMMPLEDILRFVSTGTVR